NRSCLRPRWTLAINEARQAAPAIRGQPSCRYDSRPDRIEMNIVRDLRQGVPRFDVKCLEPTLERAARLAPEPVEPRGPGSLQPFHSDAQVRLGSFHRDMKVISHDHERVNAPPEAHRRLSQAPSKGRRGASGGKNIPPVIAAID